jgi:predicted nucleotidyltransferase
MLISSEHAVKTIDRRGGGIYSYRGWYAVIEGLSMDIMHLLIEKRDDIRAAASRHGASNIRIFGSVARGQAGPDSDIDFLIDAGPNTSSWFPAGLIIDLEEILGRRVEVVTEKALNPYIRDYVLREAVPL